jgi:signal transduction histidine kinase
VDEPVSPSWRDIWLPVALLALGVLELSLYRHEGWGYAVGLEALAAGLLVLRRSHPLVFATAAVLALLAIPWVGPQLDEAAVPILYWAVAIYSLARWLPDLRGLIGLGVILVSTFVDYAQVDERAHNWTDVMFVLSLAVPPFVVGRITRRLADQNDVLQHNQELVRREAVREERNRIARELHDVIAHSVSAMVVQTAAARDLVRRDPAKAEAVLDDVAATGRRALSETGRLLHVLRDADDELGLDPAPGVKDVPALVDDFRAGGLDVRLDLDTDGAALPPGIDVSAYRIVQEALTNARKHGTGRAAVRLTADQDCLTITSINPVNGRRGSGSGLGLVGVRERVTLLGGGLSHGVVGDRFELSVTVPLDAVPER